MDEIYQAPLFKRVLSSILDVAVMFLFAIGIFMLLANGAIDIGFHNVDYKLKQYKVQEESGLFYVSKGSDGSYIEISALKYDESDKDQYKSFLKTISNYYFTYDNSPDKSESLFNTKYMLFDEKNLTNAVFSINSINSSIDQYVLLDDVLDVTTNKTFNKSDEKNYYKAIMNFFMDSNKGVYNLALTKFTNSEQFLSVVNELQAIERLEALICVAFSSLLFLALPTILNKNGETAFMHLFGICFSTSYGYKVKMSNKIIRAVMIVLLYTASAYLYFIPLLANIFVCLATKEKRSLMDLASNMTAIDKKISIIIEENEGAI